MISVPRRLIKPHPVATDIFKLGQTRNHLHVSRSRANINGIGGFDQANWANHFAEREAVPQMIERAKNALDVNPFFMNVYFKLHSGKRCSCWGKGETPDGYCVSCFKSGYVGGYDKYRCQTDLIDSTHSDLSLVNVQPDYKSGRVPIPLTLISKATAGIIEVAVKLQPNAGILDLWKVYASDTTGSSVTVFVKSPTERSWTKATEESVQARLQSGILLIRVEMKRDTTETAPPFLKAIRLRYQLQPGDIRVKMNIPLGDDSFQLQDLGIFETFQTLTFFTDNTLSVVRNEDVIVNPRDGRRFMITNVRLFNPSNTIVSWLLTGRFVNSENDSFNEYPL